MTGAMQHELLGTTLWQSVPYLAITPLYEAVKIVLYTDQSHDIVYQCPRTHAMLHVNLSRLNEGVVLCFQEERNPASLQKVPHDSERKYQMLLERVSDYVAIFTPQGLILDINQRLLANARVQRENVIGTPFPLFPCWLYTQLLRTN
jgi:PAS domain-containing protein